MEETKFTTNKKITVALALTGFAAVTVGSIVLFTNSLDPNQECSLDCPTKDPVCGQDGFWYANSCLASCSNVRIARSTQICAGAPRIISPLDGNTTTDTTVSASQQKQLDFSALLKRHADKGFHYIGQLSDSAPIAPAAAPKGYSWESATSSSPSAAAADASSAETKVPLDQDIPGAWMVIEEDGSVYVKNEDKSSAESVDDMMTEQYWGESGQTAGNPHGCVTGRSSSNTYTPPPAEPTGSEFVVSNPAPPRQLLVQGGYDSRKQIYNGYQSHYKQIGELWPIGCSGALIGPSHVLTAGHCLWGRSYEKTYGEDGSWRRSDEFYAGRTSDNSFAGMSRVTRKIIHRQYRQLHEDEFDWDYGLAVLEKPLGNDLGWMGIKFDCAPGYSSNYKDALMTLTITGFPADKPLHTMWEDTCSEINSGCYSRSVSHYCDTAPGMSGSAMIQQIPGQAPIIRAVHVAGGPSGNRATLIQRSVFHAITAWRSSSDSCPRNNIIQDSTSSSTTSQSQDEKTNVADNNILP